ncbi:YqhG family protein [Oceanobacillus senegalensis]|uniref:YqhG family protein n=1 Tax=Oceanobacillus senegalensis TaxID=1936063 RepID=UPI000A30CEA5|nr:YqhG family protein [Oceanobacillus senegalensis]
MAITNLDQFLQDYFSFHQCRIEEKQDGLLRIQLTEEMDRSLMNRPFYWHYIKKIGQKGEPMQLTLITSPDKRDEKGEWVHFGSPRLQQILNHLKNNEKFTKLFQQVNPNQNTPLYPWLVINMKISYKGKYKKDEIISIGLQLVNGNMRLEMMEYLNILPLQTSICDYCYTISPIIRLKSGFKRIEAVISNYIENQTHDWAEDSIQTLEEEKETLKHFYNNDKDNEQMEKELEEISERYKPIITFEVINGGIFYLTE